MDAVVDTSVLVDLEKCFLLTAFTRLPIRTHVTKVLYEDEIKPYTHFSQVQDTLEIETLHPTDIQLLDQPPIVIAKLSKPDLSSYLLARSKGWMLLTGDRKLRERAEEIGIQCHGVLWIFEQLLSLGILTPMALHQSLSILKNNPSSRLPLMELNALLQRFELFFLHNSIRN